MLLATYALIQLIHYHNSYVVWGRLFCVWVPGWNNACVWPMPVCGRCLCVADACECCVEPCCLSLYHRWHVAVTCYDAIALTTLVAPQLMVGFYLRKFALSLLELVGQLYIKHLLTEPKLGPIDGYNPAPPPCRPAPSNLVRVMLPFHQFGRWGGVTY